MTLPAFHPAVANWFVQTFGEPTPPQVQGWPAIRKAEHTLIAAPTGSGKTLAAFLCAIDDLVKRGLRGELTDHVHVLYVSPLKALSNDIEKNLQQPLAGIQEHLRALGHAEIDIRTAVRTGDTTASARARMTKKPPHIFVTTPESLYILLTSAGGRSMLKRTQTVIVDEIHALVRDKRGSHLALSLERLEALTERPLTRIGLSATQRPIETVASFLVGARDTPCTVVDVGHQRELDIAIEVPSSPLETVMSAEVWEEVYGRLANMVEAHRTTLLFVNTRRLAERVTRDLAGLVGKDAITSHHGSLSREHRLDAEKRLKAGELRVLVATASLELGIDIGDVDLVCQIGSPHSVAAFLQRVGRSGHWHGGLPKGRLFPMSRDDLVECTALFRCVQRGELDPVCIPEAPLDILAQQVVASVASTEEWAEDELFHMVRRAYPFRSLSRGAFDEVLRMLADGFATQRGRRGAYIHRDEVNGIVRPRRSARLAAITSGGAIPDNFDYEVRLEPEGLRVGTVNEDWAIESMAGDIFQLGNASYNILRVEPGVVRVGDARGLPPTIPFWLGEAPARTDLLSTSVNALRIGVHERMDSLENTRIWLEQEAGIDAAPALQVAGYLIAAAKALGAMPTQRTIVLERFFDETGAMHLVVHSPFGSRINRAWGLSLRKRFCRSFNIELQAAATEDAIVLSLGPMHSFPLDDVFGFLRSKSIREVLIQALLDAPMFQTRWRWNATRALAVLRFRGGKKVPPRFQRMHSDDLLAVCFPDQVACLENVAGDREIPDHPLVQQTIEDCLEEAMDIEGIEQLLLRLEAGELELIARDVTEPSPLAQEILNAKPYAFLDDAPLEERRTQAVISRRWLDPAQASDIGALDAQAIDRVQTEARPDPRNADELHDALVLHACINEAEGIKQGWVDFFESLRAQGRATRLTLPMAQLWVAAERLRVVQAALPRAVPLDTLDVPERYRTEIWEQSAALREVVRGRLEALGPTSPQELARELGASVSDIDAALALLEVEGSVLQGRFRKGATQNEWCDRRLLARIHRYTLQRLRKEIEAVSAADFLRFILSWQHATPDSRMDGPESLSAIIEQLHGYEAAAGSWEADVLPVRMQGYDPAWLDSLCLSGSVTWSRRSPAAETKNGGPIRTTPIALLLREQAASWCTATPGGGLSPNAESVSTFLSERGASFFSDIAVATGLLGTQTEDALGELVSQGIVTADGFTGLRALLVPESRRQARRGRSPLYGMESAGRWTLLKREPGEVDVESIAWTLLRRWGVVFRRLMDKESNLPPWRELLVTFRRLEAQGLVRGGRFVAGFTGEQYALPEAVGALRKVRRQPKQGTLVSISAADPLNLVGVVTPDDRIPAIAKNRILYQDGLPIAVREGGEVRFLQEQDDRWSLTRALTQREVSRQVLSYLGSAG